MRTAVARINGPGGDRCTDDLRNTQAEEAHTARPRKGWSFLPLNFPSMSRNGTWGALATMGLQVPTRAVRLHACLSTVEYSDNTARRGGMQKGCQ